MYDKIKIIKRVISSKPMRDWDIHIRLDPLYPI